MRPFALELHHPYTIIHIYRRSKLFLCRELLLGGKCGSRLASWSDFKKELPTLLKDAFPSYNVKYSNEDDIREYKGLAVCRVDWGLYLVCMLAISRACRA